MIADKARAFVEFLDGRRQELRETIAAATAELEQLDDLVAPLRGFTEQPPAGERRTDRSRDLPASATTPPAVSSACPDCDRSFTPQGLAVHRARAHKVAGATATTRERVQRTGTIPPAPISEAKNGHPSRSEKFLCSRCSRSFLSRSARDQHETQVDCQPVPTRPPASIRDTHDAALADAGILAGLGE